jgi:hypothetical protein
MSLAATPQPVDGRLLSGRYTDLLSGDAVNVADRFVMQPGEFSVLAPVTE